MGFNFDPLATEGILGVQGYLAHKKPPPTPQDYHRPNAGSQGGAVSYERGTPVVEGVGGGHTSALGQRRGSGLDCCIWP